MASSYGNIVGSVVGAVICSVGSGVFYLNRTLATREEINQTKQEMKQEVKEVKEELKSDIKENREALQKIYEVLTK